VVLWAVVGTTGKWTVVDEGGGGGTVGTGTGTRTGVDEGGGGAGAGTGTGTEVGGAGVDDVVTEVVVRVPDAGVELDERLLPQPTARDTATNAMHAQTTRSP
jgi:hypothetical protein